MPAVIRKTVPNRTAQPTHWNSAGQRPASISSSSRQLDYSSMDGSDASLGFGKSRQSCWSASVQETRDIGNNNAAHTMITIDYVPGPDAVSKIMVKRVVSIDSPIAATCRDFQPALPPDCPDIAATRKVGASKSCISEMTTMMKPDGTGIFKGNLVPRDGSTEEGTKANLNLMSSQTNEGKFPEQHRCHKAASQQGRNRNDAPKAKPKEPCKAAEMQPEIPMEPPPKVFRSSKAPEEPLNVPRRPLEKLPDVHRRSSKTSEKAPHAHRRLSKTPEKPPNAQRRSSKTPEEPKNVSRRPSKAPEEQPPKLQQQQIKSQGKLSNATKVQPIVPVKKVTDAEHVETESKNVRSSNRAAAKVDCDSLLTSAIRDRRNSRVTFAQEPGTAGSRCCKPYASSISKHEEIKRLDDSKCQEGRKPEDYAIYDSCNKKANSRRKDNECIAHDKVQVTSTHETGQGSWGKHGKASEKNAIEERWQIRHPCETETKAGEANRSEESKDTEGFSSAGEVQSKVYNHQCKQRTPDKKANMFATKKMQQQSDGCGRVRSETTLIYKAELETFPYESEESSKDKYNAESDSGTIVEIELDSRTNDTDDERVGACGSQSTGTQTEPDRGSRSEKPCHPGRWKPDDGSAKHTCPDSRSEKPEQPERAKPTDRSEKDSYAAKAQKQPPAGEQQQNGESYDIPESCLEAVRKDAELKRRREAADKARCEAMQKLLTKRPDITAPSEREKKKTHAKSQWKKTTDANVEGEHEEKPVEGAAAPRKICPGGNHPAGNSTGRKCSPDPDTTWVREGNLLIKMSDGQPSSFKVLSRDVGSGDIYNTEKSEGSTWDLNELVPPPEESILDESAVSSEVKAGKTDEESDDPLTGKKKKCCC